MEQHLPAWASPGIAEQPGWKHLGTALGHGWGQAVLWDRAGDRVSAALLLLLPPQGLPGAGFVLVSPLGAAS